MTDIAADLRRETARILARHYGGIPDAIAAIRVSTVEKISAYVDAAEDRAASCTCVPRKAFEINTARAETPAYAALRRASIDRMQERGMA